MVRTDIGSLRAVCVGAIRLYLLIFAIGHAAFAQAPKGGGTLHLGRTADPQSMDPAICYDVEALFIGRLVYHGLLDFDNEMKVYKRHATDFTLSDDRKTYTFQLKPGVTFAHGREVEAADYVYSLQRIIDPRTQSPGESFYTGIAGATEFRDGKTNAVRGLRAPDPRTFVVELTEPDYTFASKMAMTFACPVPRERLEAEGKAFWLHCFGTGPYQLTGWEKGISMRFKRVRHLNDPDEGFFDEVQVMIGGDRTLQTMMVERGEMDAVYMLQLPDIFRLRRDPLLKDAVKMIEGAVVDFLALNTELPPFDNPKVRRAIAHSIDKKRLTSLMGGSAVPATGIIPPLMPGYNPQLRGLEFNRELARRLLAEAGYAENLSFDLSYTDDDPRWARGAAAIEQDLSAVGIHAKLIKLTLPVLYTAVQTRRRVVCAYLGWSQDYPDPSNFLDVLFNGTRIQEVGGNNFAYYNNPKVNELLAQADQAFRPEERYERYQRAEKLIVEDAPVVPLTFRATPVFISPRIGGFAPHPVWTMTPERWWRNE